MKSLDNVAALSSPKKDAPASTDPFHKKIFKKIPSSAHANRTLQPLNELTDKMKPSSSDKPNLRLSIGDPTVDGNLPVPEVVTEALLDVVQSHEFDGYPPTIGYDETRKAAAQYVRRFCTTPARKEQVSWKKVIMTSGVSHGIQMALSGCCNPGDNVLVGAPSFPHYKSVCDSYQIQCRYYPLDPENHWHCDLEHAQHLVNDRTRAFIMINPSNPCGSNFSREHLQEIIDFCEKNELILISDEIYAEMVFTGSTFTSVADFDTGLPRMILGGTAKYQVCPGWRVGWAILIDPQHVTEDWQLGMERLAQLVSGPNSLCQAAIARTLLKIPASHSEGLVRQLEAGAKCYDRLLENKALGITFDKPAASMFVMLQVDLSLYKDISTDFEFYEKLLDEENVQLLPGAIFGAPCPKDKYKNEGRELDAAAAAEVESTTSSHTEDHHKKFFLRATVSRPPEILNEAIDRMIEFCRRHLKT